MTLGPLEQYITAQPSIYGAADQENFSPTVQTQYEQLVKLINAAIDKGMPPTLVLSEGGADLLHKVRVNAPTECYRDYKSGKQRPTDFAPSEISITPTQYRSVQGDAPGTSTSLYEQMAKDALGPTLVPITFSVAIYSERCALQANSYSHLHCIIFHKSLSLEPVDESALVAPISECFL